MGHQRRHFARSIRGRTSAVAVLLCLHVSAEPEPNAEAEPNAEPPPSAAMAPHEATAASNARSAEVPGAVPALPARPLATSAVDGAKGSSPPPDEMLKPIEPPRRILSSWREALSLVHARSTSLEQAQAQLEAAAAQARLALVPLYPQIGATGQVRRDILFDTTSNLPPGIAAQAFGNTGAATLWSAGLNIRQTLLAPKARYDARTSELTTQVRALDATDVERIVLANVADTIVTAVTAERLAELSRVNLSSALSTLDLTRRRARLGAGSALDVLRAEQEVTATRGQLLASDESLRRSREALGMALGFAEPFAVTPDIDVNGLIADAARVCSPVPLDDRADLRSLQAQIAVGERNLRSNRWLLSPTIDLNSNLSYSTAPFTTNGKPTQWAISAVLNIPLYDGGTRVAQTRLARSQIASQRAALTQSQRQAQIEIVQAQRSVSVAQANLAVSARGRELASETARLARLSFVNGKGTSFELVDASRRQQQAELDLVVKEFELVRSQILALLASANCDI